jgi:2,3-bisphosphoglycerate-independent phosphoglycerate mutase
MKKIVFSITVLVYCLLIAISSNAQLINVPADVQKTFGEHFKNAQVARWVPIQDSYVATFTQGQGYKDAYFTEDGEFKGVGRYITIDILPVSVQEKLNNSYSGYEIIELYQFDCVESGICFFATLKNAKNELVLKLDGTGDVSYSKKNKIKAAQKAEEPMLASKDKH